MGFFWKKNDEKTFVATGQDLMMALEHLIVVSNEKFEKAGVIKPISKKSNFFTIHPQIMEQAKHFQWTITFHNPENESSENLTFDMFSCKNVAEEDLVQNIENFPSDKIIFRVISDDLKDGEIETIEENRAVKVLLNFLNSRVIKFAENKKSNVLNFEKKSA